MNRMSCTPNLIRLDITIDIGVTSLGKYTFPNIPAFPVKVEEVANNEDEK